MGIFNKLFKRGKSQTMFTSFGNSDLGIMYDGDGYIPLARNPDVIMAVNKIADMVSNMTIQLMENTESGDVRIKDGLARKIDINPCDHMTRKSWIFKIVRDLLLFGDGNSVLHVEYDPMTDYISNLRPFPMSEVSFKLNGFTCSTSIKASGTIQGSPDWLVVKYFLAIFSRPSTVPSSSLDESTFTMRLGTFFPFMKPFLVCVAMFKLRTMSFKANLKPVPI